MGKYTLKSILLTSIDDIVVLQQTGLIGHRLKKGLLAGTVLVFAGPAGSAGVSVSLRMNHVYAKLLAPSDIPEDTLAEVIRGAAHTLYKALSFEIDMAPMYAQEELCNM